MTESTSKSTIFVTGGTGFLGRSLLPMLIAQGYQVRALSRHPEKYSWIHDLGVELIEGDVEDAQIVDRAIQGCQYVVHAAARFSFWGKHEQFERTNVRGSANVMEAAARAKVAKFVHVSTIVVIGNPLPDHIVDETHPTNPTDPYQRSKLQGEQLALSHYRDHGLPVVILRPGAFYGPFGRYAFNRLFIEDALKGIRIQVNGGKLITFPVYTGDVAASIIAALHKGRPGEVYNICGDTMTHQQANDIISDEACISHFRLNIPGWPMIALAYAWTALSEYTHVEPYYPLNLRSYVFNNWRVSSDKARHELGFQPIPFREGVRHTLDWYQQAGIWKPRRRK